MVQQVASNSTNLEKTKSLPHWHKIQKGFFSIYKNCIKIWAFRQVSEIRFRAIADTMFLEIHFLKAGEWGLVAHTLAEAARIPQYPQLLTYS